MSASKNKKSEEVYATSEILKSEKFKHYQQDFARAILTKPAYSLSEAKRLLDKTLKGGR